VDAVVGAFIEWYRLSRLGLAVSSSSEKILLSGLNGFSLASDYMGQMFQAKHDNNREATLLHYWRILKKRQLTVGLFSGILMVTVAIGTMASTPYYGSTATLEISPKTPTVLTGDSVSEVVSLTASDERRAYYATQYRILQSRTVIEEAIRRLREEHGVTAFDDEPDAYKFFKRHLKVSPELDTRLVHVVVEYPEPDTAQLFSNTLAETYIEMNLQRALGTAQQAFGWLSEQQEVYRQRKFESDQEVHDFKYDNRLQQTAILEASLLKIQEALSIAHAERVALDASYRRVQTLARSKSWAGLATHLSADSPVLLALMQDMRVKQQERDLLAAKYHAAWPALIQAEEALQGVQSQVEGQVKLWLAGKKTQLKLVSDQEAALAAESETLSGKLQGVEEKQIQLEFLQASATKNALLFKNLDQRMSEIDLASLVQSNNIWFIDRAISSDDKVRPKLSTNLPMSLLIGLLGGIALAFFMEYVDSTIKSREDLEEVVGVPFLGAVPVLTRSDLLSLPEERDRNIYVHSRPRSTAAEALRSIRTNILFRTPDKPQKRLLIASAVPREGKSFISSNLSSIIAMTGSKVLLIDADLRRPSQHKLFAVTNNAGLSSVLVGDSKFEDSIHHTHVPGLDLMPSGPRPPNPAELLGSDLMERFLDTLTQYDFVIIDSSPIGAVADPLILSRFVDGVLMVVESNKTNRDHVVQCRSRMTEVKANIIGAVVNKLDIRRTGYGYYYYYDYNSTYGDPPEERQTG
jgi:succinoglycan biosynthesis transport protein ExoP